MEEITQMLCSNLYRKYTLINPQLSDIFTDVNYLVLFGDYVPVEYNKETNFLKVRTVFNVDGFDIQLNIPHNETFGLLLENEIICSHRETKLGKTCFGCVAIFTSAAIFQKFVHGAPYF